jgi:hypothetical protein
MGLRFSETINRLAPLSRRVLIEPISNACPIHPTPNVGNSTAGEKCITPLQSDARVGMLPQDLKGVA